MISGVGQSFDLHSAAFETVHRWWKAWVDRDVETIARLADHDYAERDDLGHIRTLGSAGLDDRLSPTDVGCVITEWELYDPVTRLFNNVIVCSYAYRFSGRRGRQTFSFEGRATDVLSWKDGEWTVVSHEGILQGGRPAQSQATN